jgi:integrase
MSIRKRNGVFYYDFFVRGVRYRKAIPEATNKYQAERAEARAKDDVFSGRYGAEESSIKLKEFVEKEFLPWSRENKRSYKNDKSRSKPILTYFRSKMMREITRFNIEQYRKERSNTTTYRGSLRSPTTIDREIQLLSKIFALAIERKLLKENPCKGLKLSSVGNIVTRYLTPDEQERLIPLLTGRRKRLLDIVYINLATGMRRNEILSLHKSQIDFIRGSVELYKTKNGESRSVPIDESIRPILERLCKRAGKSGYLFENPKTGKPLKDIKTAWKNVLSDAKISGLRFHDLRHTFGTRACDGGASLSAIKDVMGHKDIRTTMRYVHATDEGKRKAVAAAVTKAKILNIVTNTSQAEKAAS